MTETTFRSFFKSKGMGPGGLLAMLLLALGSLAPSWANATIVAVGWGFTCGIKTDDTVACWGYNGYGQSTPPVDPVTFAPVTFAQVGTGSSHTCGIKKTDRTVACWGLDYKGRTIPPKDTTFTQVTVGDYHNCGIKTDGTVACWGDNTYGQATPPVEPVTSAPVTFAQVTVGNSHTCGIKTKDSTVACWGIKDQGRAIPPEGTFAQVASGTYHSCGVRTNGKVACWGWNGYDQVTPPAGTDTDTFTHVAVSTTRSCGIKTDGTVACWGTDGQVTPPPPPPEGTFTQITMNSGYAYTCGIKTNGTVVCWGYTYDRAAPPTDTTFTQVTVSGTHSCGLRPDGTAACWGNKDYGSAIPPRGVPFKLPDSAPPTTPASLNATHFPRSSKVLLSWQEATDDSGIKIYVVERCKGKGCTSFRTFASSWVRTYVDTTIEENVFYSYRVRAKDLANNYSGYSPTRSNVIRDTIAPVPPTSLYARLLSSPSRGVYLNWSSSPYADNVGVTGFVIERCEGSGCLGFTRLARPTGVGIVYTDTTVSPNTSYSYRVGTLDAAGNFGRYSPRANVLTPP